MSEERSETAGDQNLDFATVQSTYKIINALVEQLDASSNLISAMASLLGEELTRRLTETPVWANYLQTKRELENLKPDLERFATTATRLAAENKEN